MQRACLITVTMPTDTFGERSVYSDNTIIHNIIYNVNTHLTNLSAVFMRTNSDTSRKK